MKDNQPIQEVLTHWSYLARGLEYDPETFYKTLESKIEKEGVVGLSIKRVTLSQKGMLSRKRVYLRISYEQLIFDVCGAPFGESNFFFSYWMGSKNMSGCFAIVLGLILSIPIIGAIVEKNMNTLTYFQQDTATMFNTLISQIVIGETEAIMEQEDIDPIPEEAKVPNNKKLNSL